MAGTPSTISRRSQLPARSEWIAALLALLVALLGFGDAEAAARSTSGEIAERIVHAATGAPVVGARLFYWTQGDDEAGRAGTDAARH